MEPYLCPLSIILHYRLPLYNSDDSPIISEYVIPRILQTTVYKVLDSTVNESREEFTYGNRRTILAMKRLKRKVYWAKIKDTSS